MINDIASFMASNGQSFGNVGSVLMRSSQFPITVMAWFVSIFVYIDCASAVNSIAVEGRFFIPLTYSTMERVSFTYDLTKGVNLRR